MTTTAVSPGTSTSTPRHASSGSTVAVRRAPVLLRLPALHEAPPAAPNPPKRESMELPATPPVEPADAALIPEPDNEPDETENEPREKRRSQRRERKSRSSRESVKKPALSQWILGGCMLATGVLGFFALSGDFGGSSDAPPADGWRERAEAAASAETSVQPPEVSLGEVTAHRQPITVSQDPRNWSNPAEAEIVQTPASPSTQAATSFMSETTSPSDSAGTRNAASAFPTTTGEASQAAATSHETPEAAQFGPPLNQPTGAEAPSAYPTTSAAGLNPAAAPYLPGPQQPYPRVDYGSTAASNPAAGATGGAPPAFSASSPYPTTAADPASMYPTTGAASSPFPNTNPSAMNPRYERIR